VVKVLFLELLCGGQQAKQRNGYQEQDASDCHGATPLVSDGLMNDD
jgi:hypothetical protein